MKFFATILVVLFILSFYTLSFAENYVEEEKGVADVVAPSYYDANANVGFLPSGSIIFDTKDGIFKGRSGAGSWLDLSISATGTAPFYIDATIGGGNPGLGTSSVTTYTGLTNSGLTLSKNIDSAAVYIACASTEQGTSTSCTTYDESVGIVFDVPSVGTYRACVEFSHYVNYTNSSVNMDAVFQIIQTGNTDQTTVASGNSRIQSSPIDTNHTNNVQAANPINLCGNFKFSSTGAVTLRLMYTQSASGTISNNFILADQGSSESGNRDIHWTVWQIK